MKMMPRWLPATLFTCAAAIAQAAGPQGVCANGTPIKFPGTGSVNLNYDLGGLGTRSKAQADLFVTNSVAIWTSVGTSSVVLGRGPDMPVDVTVANISTYYPNSAANTSDGLNPVIYDTDGSIIDGIFGVGAKNNLLGFATARFANCQYTEGVAFVSGFKPVSDTTLGVVFAHEIGHLLGLDHAQLDNTQGIASTGNYPLMYPLANRGSVTLHEDDIASISLLYPDPTLNTVFGQITGTFVLADGVTPVRGANLWAREATTGKVYSVVSDYLKQNSGFFRMLLPAGSYTLHAEAVQSNFIAGSSVGPYAELNTDASFQPPLYPAGIGGAPMAAVTLGNGTPTSFQIAAACNATVTFGINGSGTIGGNCPAFPGTLQFTAATASVGEAAGSIAVSVSRINGSDGAASVNYSTSGISATAGGDFTAPSGTLSWAAGDSADKTIVVPIAGDALIEGDETFSITLSAAARASIGATSVTTITIVDDDVATAPGAPVNLVAIPGNAQAFIRFMPPVTDGGSPITGYIATCGALTGFGTASPINVTGLLNDTTYDCSVVAVNALGAGVASIAVTVTPSALAPLALVDVVSRKLHAGAGGFEISIDTTQPFGGPVTVEPRFIGSGHTLVYQFNAPVSLPATVSVTPPGAATATVVAAAGNKLTVSLTGVADNQRITVSLSDINGGAAEFPVSAGFLVGDFNNTRAVTASDISGARARIGSVINTANFRFDVNLTGTIDQADISAARRRSGLVLP